MPVQIEKIETNLRPKRKVPVVVCKQTRQNEDVPPLQPATPSHRPRAL